ncbi:hypothetical protein I8748_27665 [Nostoc sp. CENA67]|uniref:Uncharacterized protein n=1 Tax=Amazonocrinis nigriterrae CENA67 TaxID=2794033 RepID=A0A8J7LBN0_9NOST|nr:hypothetical protein [Amazonocrinis nigriterrae]MBH8565900.1 hypothetical protein [Amazonocrinis nigriterrae CENA67]
MAKSKMGGMKLSQFSGIGSNQAETIEPPQESTPEPVSVKESASKEKPVFINIKISREQHEWLSDTARTVRDNNTEPVPPGDRVYPQHLIGVAVELLQNSDVDWSQVKNVEDLRQQLKL